MRQRSSRKPTVTPSPKWAANVWRVHSIDLDRRRQDRGYAAKFGGDADETYALKMDC